MKLPCKALAADKQFTPGQTYEALPGLTAGGARYFDLYDDDDQLWRYSEKPRKGVPNEVPLYTLDSTFEVPPGTLPQRHLTIQERVHQEIRKHGFERPLLIVPRGDAERWVAELQKLASTETRPIRPIYHPGGYNDLVLLGMPRGIYVSTLAKLFLNEDGGLLPTYLGQFDFLFVSN